MGNADRIEPLTMIGPKGLEKVVGALRTIAPELPFPIIYKEISGPEQTFELNGYTLKAFKVNHNVLCYGYSLSIARAGKFDADRAKAQEIPLKFWSRLQKGETITEGEKTYKPDMVLGPERKGLKVTYTTDTRPTRSIVENAAGSDLLICEGMYGEKEMLPKAVEHKHMMFDEAAQVAAEAGVESLWLTHYSPSLVRPQQFIKQTRKIFEKTIPGENGMTLELKFDEE